MRSFFILFAAILLFSACSLRKHPGKDAPDGISYGSGGGFTGAVDEYFLKSTGTLCKVNIKTKDTIIIKTLPKKTSNTFFARVTTTTLQQMEINQPGNMTYYLTLVKGNKIIHSYHWTDGMDIPAELSSVYQDLMAQTR